MTISVVTEVGFIIAATTLTDAQYFALTISNRLGLDERLGPAWYWFFKLAQIVWVAIELICMMSSPKRRTLHDIIAGTVVIVKNPANPVTYSAVFPNSIV